MIDGEHDIPGEEDMRPDWEARERESDDDHDTVDALPVAQSPAPHAFLVGADENTSAEQDTDHEETKVIDLVRAPAENIDRVDSNEAGALNVTLDRLARDNEKSQQSSAGAQASALVAPAIDLEPSVDTRSTETATEADQAIEENTPQRREISSEDLAVLERRVTGFFDRYHRGGGLIGNEPIEERRLGGVLPFIGMLGFDVFDRAEVKVVSESRYLVGKEDDKFIVSLDQAGGLPDDIILSTNGRKFDLRIQGDSDSTTIALLDVSPETSVLPHLFRSLSREGFDLAHLRAMASRGAIEDVLREALLEELRNPSSHLRAAISERLQARGYDDSALAGLAAIGQNIAADAVTGENESDVEEAGDKRKLRPDEQFAYQEVRTLLSAYVDVNRISARPGQSYTAVLLDDNNRRSVARLYYNADRAKYLATLTGRADSNKVDETRHLLGSPVDIKKFAEKIIARLKEIDADAVP